MSYVIQAVLSNARHPENGRNEILFPLAQKDYADEVQRLGELGAGDAVRQDCMVEEIDSAYEVLACLKGQVVNVDELDYLAKRLDSFDVYEAVQFQAACAVFDLKDIKDFINMTFCCKEVTVISDFSKLEEAGRRHYLTIHGSAAPVEELDKADGKALAQKLIQSGEGTPTPYGLFFRNGVQMEAKYDGYGFPSYLWESAQAELEIKAPNGYVARLFLPVSEVALERFQKRERISDLTKCKRSLWLFRGPKSNIELTGGMEEFREWNQLCERLSAMSEPQQQKLYAAVEVTGAEDLAQLRLLSASTGEFDLIPGITDAEGYGKYMIQESDRYAYDADLECYYNYKAFGEFLMLHETGRITSQGYLKCKEDSAFIDFFTHDAPKSVQNQTDQSMEMGGLE